ncbi:acyltransferase family protein [Bacillus sp. 3255]|uniref:acyltransferase family protein n=1 Tax=Bacillus sp. 3255 TaxID=2817904 RepID=UPI0028550F75|nr:acyltransferase family protein [Bacillus sp. 3255]MDR6880293.1 peptidoglycan/LPS O-acetylase OafA/YrhL [Bacillus sp. 3255]
MQESNKQRYYMHGLDGIRALAVLAVIGYHLNWEWASGGFLGVSVFFVLSGYLIMDMLLEERRKHKRIRLGRFWIRRTRRLLPAMLSMIAAAAIYLGITDFHRLQAHLGEFGAAITYTSNWYNIFHQVSYFESFGPPSPLGHLWSLAIEEQFYLVWPLLLVILSKLINPTRGKLLSITLVGAILSFIAMVLIYEPGTDPSRVYLGTDTRAFGLLIGVSLAILFPSAGIASLKKRNQIWIDLTGTIGLMALIYMFIWVEEYDRSLYYGGMLLISIISAFVIMAAARPTGVVSKILRFRPLLWIGRRSYSIYLWHFPVILLTNPVDPNTPSNYTLQFLQLTLSILLAAMSYSLIETPFRSGNWRIWTQWFRHPWARLALLVLMLICASITYTRFTTEEAALSKESAISVETTTLASAKKPENISPAVSSPEATISQTAHFANKVTTHNPIAQPDLNAPSPTPPPEAKRSAASTSPVPTSTPGVTLPPDSTSAVQTADPKVIQPAESENENAPGGGASKDVNLTNNEKTIATSKTSSESKLGTLNPTVTAIGDSVMLGAATVLEKKIAGIFVDGKLGRQMSQAADLVEEIKTNKKLGGVVVIHLGTNGSFTSSQLEQLIAAIGEKRNIILINTRVPRKWQSAVNNMLVEASKTYPNVKLVDWYSYSEKQSEWFANDGVHLTTKGAEAYSELIMNAVSSKK